MKRILLFLAFTLTAGLISAQTWNEVVKLVASDRAEQDFYGTSSDIDGEVAIVGASQQDVDADGLDTLSFAGAAYVYEKGESASWDEVVKLLPNDRNANDYFGFSVGISGDYIIVGSPYESSGVDDVLMGNAGSAYIFEKDINGDWLQAQKLAPIDRDNNDFFGYTVAIDGNIAVVAAHKDEHDENGLNELTNAGSAYIFERNSAGVWEEKQKIVASDRAASDDFGLALSVAGDVIAVGVFKNDTDVDGLNTMNQSGSVYIFEKIGGVDFVETQKIVASDRTASDKFGRSVGVSGDYIVVGSFNEDEDENGANFLSKAGSAYIYHYDTESNNWEEVQKLVNHDRVEGDEFGKEVDIDMDRIIVASYKQDFDSNGENELIDAGAAYIYQKGVGDLWELDQKISAAERLENDRIATSVAISGENVIMGSTNQDFDVDGLNEMANAGAAYIFNYGILTSISDQYSNKADIQVYPNPTQGLVAIKFVEQVDLVEFNVINSLGQSVFYGKYDGVKFIQEQLSLDPGVYFVQINSNSSNLITERLIIK